jgi:hypothetical protein
MRVQKFIFLMKIAKKLLKIEHIIIICHYNSTKNYEKNYYLVDFEKHFDNVIFAFDTIEPSQKKLV